MIRLRPISIKLLIPTLGLMFAGALTVVEFRHYSSFFDFIFEDDWLTFTAIMFGLLAKSVLVLLPPMLVASAMAAAGWNRSALVISSVSVVFLGLYIVADISVQRMTGNNSLTYLEFVLEPNAMDWAGRIDYLSVAVRWLGKTLIIFMVSLIPSILFAWYAEKRLESRLVISLLGIAWAAGLLSGPLVQFAAPASIQMHRVSEAQPWRWDIGLGGHSDTSLKQAEQQSQKIYQRFFDAVQSVHDKGPVIGLQVENKPDVLLLVIESFRGEALDPSIMPNLWELSEKGVRFTRHNAGSNRSHFGIFSLLHGQPAYAYFATIAAGVQPAMLARFRELDYNTTLLYGAHPDWKGMQESFNQHHFDQIKVYKEGERWQRDRKIVDDMGRMLENSEGMFIMAYLLSTHFWYDYPPGSGPFKPDLPAPLGSYERPADREQLLNRYNNSAFYVDRLLGRLLDTVDLDNTLIVVTGDHGESIYEDGTLAHGSRMSQVQTHVPLVIAGGNTPAGVVIDRPTEQANIITTMLSLIGAAPVGGFDMLDDGGLDFSVNAVMYARMPGRQNVTFNSPHHTYSFMMWDDAPKLEILGRMLPDGRVDPFNFSVDDEQRFIRWFRQFIQRWGRTPGGKVLEPGSTAAEG